MGIYRLEGIAEALLVRYRGDKSDTTRASDLIGKENVNIVSLLVVVRQQSFRKQTTGGLLLREA